MRRKGIRIIVPALILMALMWLFIWVSATRAQEVPSFELVKAGCKSALSAVASGKGQVTVYEWKEHRSGAVTEYQTVCNVAFRGDKYRLSVAKTILRNDPQPDVPDPAEVGSGDSWEISVGGNQVTQWWPHTRKAVKGDGTQIGTKSASCMISTVSDIAVLGRSIPGNGIVDIAEIKFLDPRVVTTTAKIIGRDVVGDSECILVEIAAVVPTGQPTRIIHVWVDPEEGFTSPLVRTYLEGGPYAQRTLAEESLAQMREYQPGVWYPQKVTRTYYRLDDKGLLRKYRSTVVSYDAAFQLNVDVREDQLSLALPSGTRVHDEVLDIRYSAP